MDHILITGGRKLKGEVSVSGAKNSALPILAASLLSEEESIIDNIPHLRDIQTMVRLLRSLGAKVHFENGTLSVKPGKEIRSLAAYKLVSTMPA